MLNYKKKLILAYFNNVGESYSFRELSELFGLTNIQTETIIEELLEEKYLYIKNSYILSEKAIKVLEKEKNLESNLFENDLEEEVFTNKPLDFMDIYIPKNFEKKFY